MTPFMHYAIAHGIHYGQGKYFHYCLIARRSEIDPLIKAWSNNIIWC